MKLTKILIALILISALLCGCAAKEGFVIKGEGGEIHYTEQLELVGSYPHSASSFTQGLFFHGGEMYESTGLYGQSKIFKNIDIKTGQYESEYSLPANIFGEGSVVMDNTLYVLSWQEGQVFKFDPDNLTLIDTVSYPREGWGLTTNGEQLIASDGTSKLYFMDADLNDIKNITVKFGDIEINRINELEYIDGLVWANIWLTQSIAVIDPENGEVKYMIDFSGLSEIVYENPDAVLNGIAYDKENGRLYITGKNWDSLYEFELKKN